MEKINMSWSLANLYQSFEDKNFLLDIELLIEKIEDLIEFASNNFQSTEDAKAKLENYLVKIMDYRKLSSKLSGFAFLTNAADVNDKNSKKYQSYFSKLNTKLTKVFVNFSNWLGKIENLNQIIQSSTLLTEHEFYLNEVIQENKYVLSEKEEVAIAKMKLTSSIAWANYKNQVASNHKVDIELDGKQETIGINQIKNMYFSKDKEVRKKAFYAERKSNENIAEAVSASLNGIKGEVLTLCELKGYQSPLHKTLVDSRMDEATLNTMLKVMKDNLGEFQRYFRKKAELLGYSEKLPYYDIMAPVGSKEMNFTYEEAKGFIVEHFNSFSPELGNLALEAFNNRWIDAEARDGKRGGAFCSNLHSIKESRILCTYGGTIKNVSTLAHELGHAYHGMILQKETPLNSSYPMPLAETASIFAENIVRNAALEIASPEEEIAILGTELVNSSSVIVDIYARFIFEKELFEKRSEGDLSVEEINEIMVKAQKEAYGAAIDEDTFDQYAWIHKPHYYYAERNFYNFPYAFGLLFAKGLYNIYLKEGKDFVKKYNDVLRLTGRASVYDVAKSVGIDLHDEAFWIGSMEMIKKDIDKFCNM